MKRILLSLLFFFIIGNINGIAHSEACLNRINVPTPWSPIKVFKQNNEVSIECWGRKYVFNNSILPSQIYSKEVPLLNGAIQIILSNNSKRIKWKEGLINVVNANADSVNLIGQLSSDEQPDEIVITSKIHIEYDGLMLISLSISSHLTENSSLKLVIPYKKNVAKLYLKWLQNYHNKYSGVIPDSSGLLSQSQYTPYYWIGNNYIGLFWFCQGTKHWPNSQSEGAINILGMPDQVLQQFDIGHVDHFEFGLQATPVKALPDDWRDWRLSPASGSNIVILWVNPGSQNSVKYYGWPQPENPEVYKKLIATYHEQGKKVIAYEAISRLPSLCPFYQRNKQNWILGKYSMKLEKDSLVYVNPNSLFYADSIGHIFAKYMREYGLDGYYLDGVTLYPYWKSQGGLPYYPILGYRNLYRIFYDSLKAANPNAIIISHMSGDMDIPVLAYSDAYLDGEQFREGGGQQGTFHYLAADSYTDIISLPQFRAEFIGSQWGIIPFFLPEINPSMRKDEQPTEGLASLLLLHDVQPWATNSNLSVWNKMYHLLDTFNFSGSTFIPYYDSIPPAFTKMKGVYISAYKKNNGQCLIIVSNLSNNNEQGVISLNLNLLGVKNIHSAFCLTQNDNLNYDGSNIPISIGPMQYRLIWIK